MEVIHLVMGKANPDRMNGVNRMVYQLATTQAEEGVAVSVWGFTKDMTVNYGERNFDTRLFYASRNPFYLDPNFVEALRELDPKQVVFHLHGGWIPLFYPAAKAIVQAGLRYVLTPHGAYNVIAMRRSNTTKKFYFQLFEKFVVQHAQAIHCIGASEVAGLHSIYKTDKTFLQPFGMKMVKQPEALAPSGDLLVFGFLGRLDYYTKGLDLMLESFGQYFRDDPSVALWIVGDGAGRKEVEDKITALKLENNVILHGAKYGQEKEELLRRMNVFLHPSRNEGMPTAVLEAAAMGIPSIVTEATNIGDYLQRYHAGFVVENENVPQLADAMQRMRKTLTTELKKIGGNARAMVSEQFSWPHVVHQFNQLYR